MDVAAQLEEAADRAGPPPAAHVGEPSRSRRARPAAARRASRRPARRVRRAVCRTRRAAGRRRSPMADPWRSATAMSASPRSTALCTSFTNTPWPPIVCSGTSACWVRSPSVSTKTSSTSRPGCAAINASATACAWVRAWALARVAKRSGRSPCISVSRGRTGRGRWRRCARPAACRRRPSASPTACATAWRRCPWSLLRPRPAACRRATRAVR